MLQQCPRAFPIIGTTEARFKGSGNLDHNMFYRYVLTDVIESHAEMQLGL